MNGGPHVIILEQPAASVRYRYRRENVFTAISGANSTPKEKTFPKIKVVGFEGRVTVIASCVTKDDPYRPHPHCLVGEDCKMGIFQKQVDSGDLVFSFPKLGIESTKKDQFKEVLQYRQKKRLNPFDTGYDHSRIDINVVRLCFQVCIFNPELQEWSLLPPVVSDPVHNDKHVSPLKICRLSDCSAPVAGGKEILMFCDKVNKDDIEIWFFEQSNERELVQWEAKAKFSPADVHQGYGIAFRTPSYLKTKVAQPVEISIQLRRPSDNAVSNSLPFQLLPNESDFSNLRRKMPKYAKDSGALLDTLQTSIVNSNPMRKPPVYECSQSTAQSSCAGYSILTYSPGPLSSHSASMQTGFLGVSNDGWGGLQVKKFNYHYPSPTFPCSVTHPFMDGSSSIGSPSSSSFLRERCGKQFQELGATPAELEMATNCNSQLPVPPLNEAATDVAMAAAPSTEPDLLENLSDTFLTFLSISPIDVDEEDFNT